jgi:hypothetical protein
MLSQTLQTLGLFSRTPAEVSYTDLETIAPAGSLRPLLPAKQVPTPEAKTMPLHTFSAHLNRPTYVAPEVRSALLSGVRYCPTNHCVVDTHGAVLRESTGPGARRVGLAPRALHVSTTPLEGVATALRCHFNDFYHFLIDNLSRFDLLNLEYFRSFPSISLLCPGGLTDLEAFFVEKLLPANVSVLDVPEGTLYAPEQFLFNTFITSRSSGYLRGPFVERLQKRLAPGRVPLRTERIYVSRRRARKGRHIQNEDALMDRLRLLGFRQYVLEDLPISEQIALFQRADMIVAPHGAGLSNILFSRQASVLELFAGGSVVPHYYLLAKSLGHRYDYLLGPASHPDENFSVDVDAVTERVRALASDLSPSL